MTRLIQALCLCLALCTLASKTAAEDDLAHFDLAAFLDVAGRADVPSDALFQGFQALVPGLIVEERHAPTHDAAPENDVYFFKNTAQGHLPGHPEQVLAIVCYRFGAPTRDVLVQAIARGATALDVYLLSVLGTEDAMGWPPDAIAVQRCVIVLSARPGLRFDEARVEAILAERFEQVLWDESLAGLGIPRPVTAINGGGSALERAVLLPLPGILTLQVRSFLRVNS